MQFLDKSTCSEIIIRCLDEKLQFRMSLRANQADPQLTDVDVGADVTKN